MVQHETQIRASWGHCDAAGIIYYPNYFDWFDQCFQGLLAKAGWTQRDLQERWGCVGTGAIDASSQFRSPITYGDTVDTTTFIERWSERSFTVYHRFDNAGTLAVEGREVRLWLRREGDDDKSIIAERIPEEFKRRLGWSG